MAEFERTSYQSLSAIPEEHQFQMHRMYEDTDLTGAETVEAIFDFIEKEVPGLFVIVLANDSVSPPCCNSEGHYHCDFYAPYWHSVLVPAKIWQEYQGAVWAANEAHKQAHQCKAK